ETLELRHRNGLNLGAQAVDGKPMNPGQEPALAPFEIGRSRIEFSAQDKALGFQSQQSGLDLRRPHREQARQSADGDRPADFHSPADQLAQRFVMLPLPFRFGLRRRQRRSRLAAGVNTLQQRQALRRDPEFRRVLEPPSPLFTYEPLKLLSPI